MRIESVEFIKSVYSVNDLPAIKLPEVTFFGRSNVGKSSLINTLLSKKIARISQTPGKTQCLNYYLINHTFYFVDAPGYGYAKAPVSVLNEWNTLINDWVKSSNINSRQEPQKSDLNLFSWLINNKQNFILVVNKIDKLKTQQLRNNLEIISSGYQIKMENLVPFSTKDGTGKNVLWKLIQDNMLSAPNQ
jgi:GTP-binding protein